MQKRFRMVVEIDVQVEFLAFEVLVRTAADVIGIVAQRRDARDAPHEVGETRGRSSAHRTVCTPVQDG